MRLLFWPMMMCFALGGHAKTEAATPLAGTLKVMTYNVENLFDWTHDEGKEDWTYLPLTIKEKSPAIQAYCASQPTHYQAECFQLDWSEKVVRRKIANLAQVILASFPGGPDVVVVQEVENIAVLTLLAQAVGNDYQAHLIEGPDGRGVDVGFITRLPVLKSEIRTVPMTGAYQTRGVMRVDLQTAAGTVSVLANHWPSQSNPDEDRLSAAQVMLKLAQEAATGSRLVVAAGDFNTSADDARNGIKEMVLPVALDAEGEARGQGRELIPAGTYNFRGVWGSLDHIFLLKGPHLAVQNWETVRILSSGLIITRRYNGRPEDHPMQYDPKTGIGFSDHLPLVMEIRL